MNVIKKEANKVFSAAVLNTELQPREIDHA